MSLVFCVILVLGTASSKPCPGLDSPRHGTVACVRGNSTVRCEGGPPSGSVARFSCHEFYRLEGPTIVKCKTNGRWSEGAPNCVTDCGRRSQSVSLIVNGLVAPRGAFPWHVGIYNLIDGRYEYWCGGSLVSEWAVITAAHCTWEIPVEKLMLVFGKHHRRYDWPEENVQKIKARKVEMLDSYQDVVGNYNGDVAVIVLEEPVAVGHLSAPVCVDWDQNLTDEHLSEGSEGVVLGWGLTEGDTFSDILRAVRLPVVSARKCIAAQEEDFKKFITCTSFCAGFLTRVGVCNGDSGGGLAFFDEASARWYVQGVVSVSPRRKGTPHCNPDAYTVFTKVSMFTKWLKKVVLAGDKGEKGFHLQPAQFPPAGTV